MASLNTAEGSRSGLGKTYITFKKHSERVRRQKKTSGNRCNHRKGCGTSYGVVPGKKRFKRKS